MISETERGGMEKLWLSRGVLEHLELKHPSLGASIAANAWGYQSIQGDLEARKVFGFHRGMPYVPHLT